MEQLIKEVQQLGVALSKRLRDYQLEPVFQSLTLGSASKKRLLDLDAQGRVVINNTHPLAKKLADGKPGRAQALVSAIICMVNRAEKDLTDEHQRQLHCLLLEDMVDAPARS